MSRRSTLFALEHVHRAGDVARDVNVVIVLEQPTQTIAGVLFVVDDEDRGLDGIHEGSWRRNCANYSHSIARSLNEKILEEPGKIRDKPNRTDRARFYCEVTRQVM